MLVSDAAAVAALNLRDSWGRKTETWRGVVRAGLCWGPVKEKCLLCLRPLNVSGRCGEARCAFKHEAITLWLDLLDLVRQSIRSFVLRKEMSVGTYESWDFDGEETRGEVRRDSWTIRGRKAGSEPCSLASSFDLHFPKVYPITLSLPHHRSLQFRRFSSPVIPFVIFSQWKPTLMPALSTVPFSVNSRPNPSSSLPRHSEPASNTTSKPCRVNPPQPHPSTH